MAVTLKQQTTQIFSRFFGNVNICMPYKCPLGKLPTKKTYKVYNSDIIPEAIKLPDGREIPVKDISNKIKNRENINLHNRKPRKPSIDPAGNFKKYSPGERLWQSNQTLEVLCARYNINEKQAYAMKWQAKGIIDYMTKMGMMIVDDFNEKQ